MIYDHLVGSLWSFTAQYPGDHLQLCKLSTRTDDPRVGQLVHHENVYNSILLIIGFTEEQNRNHALDHLQYAFAWVVGHGACGCWFTIQDHAWKQIE